MTRQLKTLSIAALALVAFSLCADVATNNPQHVTTSVTIKQQKVIEDVTNDYDEVCVGGVVYYRRKPKSGFAADYSLSPKIVMAPKTQVMNKTSNYGSHQRC